MVVLSTYFPLEFSWCLGVQSWVYSVSRRGLSTQPWWAPMLSTRGGGVTTNPNCMGPYIGWSPVSSCTAWCPCPDCFNESSTEITSAFGCKCSLLKVCADWETGRSQKRSTVLHSKQFFMMGVRATGQHSLRLYTADILGNGMMVACFKQVGTISCESVMLKISATASVSQVTYFEYMAKEPHSYSTSAGFYSHLLWLLIVAGPLEAE